MADINLIKELRQRTGAGIVDCKKALEDNGDDIEKAIIALREKGLSKAAKRAGREAVMGAIIVDVADDRKTATIAELNSETDFVAETEAFKGLVPEIFSGLKSAYPNGNEGEVEVPADLDEKIKLVAGKTGENVNLRRFVRCAANSEKTASFTGKVSNHSCNGEGFLAVYQHFNKEVGSLVELAIDKKEAADTDDFKNFHEIMTFQIAANSPKYISRDEVPAEIIEAEKEIYRNEMKNDPKNANKPDDILDKIILGKINKLFYKENCLMDQAYFDDDNISVLQAVEKVEKKLGAKIAIRRIIRFQLGEPLD